MTVALCLVIFCIRDISRKVPINYILLFGFTLFESYCLSVLTSFYSTDAVIIAAALTLAVTLGLTLYAFKTKTDFTFLGAFLFAASIGLIIFAIILAVLPFYFATVIYCLLGTLLFAAYLVYDT